MRFLPVQSRHAWGVATTSISGAKKGTKKKRGGYIARAGIQLINPHLSTIKTDNQSNEIQLGQSSIEPAQVAWLAGGSVYLA